MVESLGSQITLGDITQARRKFSKGTDKEIFVDDEPNRIKVNGFFTIPNVMVML